MTAPDVESRMDDNKRPEPGLVVTVFRRASLDAAALQQVAEDPELQPHRWHWGRAPWIYLWNDPAIRRNALLAHDARTVAGVNKFLVARAYCPDPEVSRQHPDDDFMVHLLFPQQESGEGPQTYFEAEGFTPWGVTFLRMKHAAPDPPGGSADVIHGWVAVNFLAQWDAIPPPDIDDDGLEQLLKPYVAVLDVLNIPQPRGGSENVDCLRELLASWGRLVGTPEETCPIQIHESDTNPYNHLLVLARVPESKDEAKEAERHGRGLVRRYSDELVKQQRVRGRRIEDDSGVGNISWDYRAVTAGTHRLVQTVPSSGDPSGVISHFVDVYPAFLLATIQEVELSRFSQDLQDEEYFDAIASAQDGDRAASWSALLRSQANYYAFRSKFWWVQWARRGVGVRLLPRLQSLWHTDVLAQQLSEEYRDYGTAASAELARLSIKEEADRERSQQGWRLLATSASIIVGGLTLLGVWAELAGLESLHIPGDDAGLARSLGILISSSALLLLLSSWVMRRYRDNHAPRRTLTLMLAALLLPIVVLLFFGVRGKQLDAGSWLLIGVGLTAAFVFLFLAVRELLIRIADPP